MEARNWKAVNRVGAGWEIEADVKIGKDDHGTNIQPIYQVSIEPSLRVNKDGTVTMMVAYEDWRQFPSTNFQEMQADNAHLIEQAPDMLEALKGVAIMLRLWNDNEITNEPWARKVREILDTIEKGGKDANSHGKANPQ